MGTFPKVEQYGAEQVIFCSDRASGLRAIIAIHSTVLGPALGGTRFRAYRDETEAIEDALRLAQGMTSKAAAAGLHLGGGKAVIIGDPSTMKSDGLLRAYGRHLHALRGRFVTAEDVGTCQADMDLLRSETPFVVGVSPRLGGTGDPSAMTARGVLRAMEAAAERLWGTPELRGRRVVISGIGKVGSALAALLVEAGSDVRVSDVDGSALERLTRCLDVEIVPVADAHRLPCDVFAPCALGGVLDAVTAAELGCRVVVGSANNQLAEPGIAKVLDDAGVLYVPDFIANAGGLITVAGELHDADPHETRRAVECIYDTTSAVLALAAAEHVTPAEAADRLAERRIATARAPIGSSSAIDTSPVAA